MDPVVRIRRSDEALVSAFRDISEAARETARRIAPVWKQFYASLPPDLRAELGDDANDKLTLRSEAERNGGSVQ